MDIIDLTSGGYVYRWTLVAGYPRCVEDCISANDAGALSALQRNAAIRSALVPVLAHEAAQALVARGEPDNGQPKKVPESYEDDVLVVGEDANLVMVDNPAWELLPRMRIAIDPQTGEETEEPEPCWVAYDAAVALIAEASPVVKAFALWRRPEPADTADGHLDWLAAGQLVGAAIDAAAETPLQMDPRPWPSSISRRQFGHILAKEDTITEAEAIALVARGEIPVALETVIALLPEKQQFDARILVAGAATFEFDHPLIDQIAVIMGKSPAQKRDLFRAAGVL